MKEPCSHTEIGVYPTQNKIGITCRLCNSQWSTVLDFVTDIKQAQLEADLDWIKNNELFVRADCGRDIESAEPFIHNPLQPDYCIRCRQIQLLEEKRKSEGI